MKSAVDSLTVTLATLILVANSNLPAQEPKELWPAGAPGAIGKELKDRPRLFDYALDGSPPSGTAVIIFPGGGYHHLAMEHEGHEIARWLNQNGIHAFICDYRHRGKGYGHPAPMQDAQRAIRLVRSRANHLGIQPDQIGVLGFSAGGHLASTASTHFDAGDDKHADPIQRWSSRPDFAILCYPVIAFGEEHTHIGSQHGLLGKQADESSIRKLSSEKQVTAQTPPTFLWHTSDDKGVPAENSIQYFLALKKQGVPVELHLYQTGRHGLGLASNAGTTAHWPDACLNWLKANQWLK